MGTLSESVCENVWESKADTLCRPACAQTLVLVNPFSKGTNIKETTACLGPKQNGKRCCKRHLKKIVVIRRHSNIEMKIHPLPDRIDRRLFGQFSNMAMGLCHNFNK